MSATSVARDIVSERTSLYEYIQGMVEKFDTLQVQKLWQKYNSLYMPCRLPPDILKLVFEYIRDDHDEEGVRRSGWIARISHVCTYWREVALGDPQLWNDIVLQSPWAPEKLKRAQTSLVSIDAQLRLREFGDIQQVLNYLPQTRKLVLLDMTPRDNGIEFGEMLADLMYAPCLESCTIEGEIHSGPFYKISDQFLANAPQLRNLSIQICGISWTSPVFGPALTTLSLTRIAKSLQPSISEIISILDRAPNLERLLLRYTFAFSTRDFEPLNRAISLPRLLYLDIRTDPKSFKELMRHVSHPMSTTVNVRLLGEEKSYDPNSIIRDFFEIGEILGNSLQSIFYLNYMDGQNITVEAWDFSQQDSQDISYEQRPRERPRLWLQIYPGNYSADRYAILARLISALPIQELSVLSMCNLVVMFGALWWIETFEGLKSLKTLQIETIGWELIRALISKPSAFEALCHLIARK